MAINGILIVDKPAGMTSFDVVAALRRATGERRVGHAGTLDPLATGVLPICLGQATRMVQYLSDDSKAYRAEVVLGVSTDTYDAEGRAVESRDASGITRAQAEQALGAFQGEIAQTPPMYSAVKVAGRRLYDLARAGIEVPRPPRTVRIYAVRLVAWSPPVFTFDVECSKGTYVRSLAHDLGQRLGCGAHLRHLVRQRSGRFTLEDAHSLPAVQEAFRRGTGEDLLCAADEAVLGWEAVIVGEGTARSLRHGQPIALGATHTQRGRCRAYSEGGTLVALLELDAAAVRWQPRSVFALES